MSLGSLWTAFTCSGNFEAFLDPLPVTLLRPSRCALPHLRSVCFWVSTTRSESSWFKSHRIVVRGFMVGGAGRGASLRCCDLGRRVLSDLVRCWEYRYRLAVNNGMEQWTASLPRRICQAG